MKKLIISILCLFFILCGCKEKAAPSDVHVIAMKGPTAMGMVKMMDENDKGNITSNNYDFKIIAAIDEVTAKLMNGEADIAALPANVASTLYNNSNGAIRVIGINTLSVLYIVEKGEAINDIKDLEGKTIYASGKGATPEYALRYVLEENDIDAKIEFKSEQSECVGALLNDENGVALLPEPFVTTALMSDEDLRVALDLNDYYEDVVTGVVVARSEFIEENEAVIKDFLDHYEASVKYVNENIDAASSLIEKYDIVKAVVAKKALPSCHIVLIKGEAMKEKLASYLNDLYNYNPKAVGGKLPLDDFYYGA